MSLFQIRFYLFKIIKNILRKQSVNLMNKLNNANIITVFLFK